jgi:septal ring factor EnvC (AmiA/AmiB activator)
MKAVLATGLFAVAAGSNAQADPIGQVIDLLSDLSAKVKKEGEADQAAYEDYFSWCDDTSKQQFNDLKTSNDQKSKLEASIAELTSEAEVCDTKISDLVAAISANSKDLDAATKIRADEEAVFSKNDAELADVVETVAKAITKLAAAAGSAAFAQVANGANLASTIQSLNAIIDAASFSNTDKQKLVALVQSHQESEEDDSELGAPAAANYEKKSGDIVSILEDMKDKAETQLSDLRKAEKTAKFNFEKLKQSIDDQVANDNSDLGDQKKKKAGAEEGRATAEGELEVTEADIKTTSDSLAQTQKDCMQVAIDHENAIAAMKEELRVLAEAKKIIVEATSFVQTSFVQTNMEVAMQSVSSKIAKFVRKLAKEQNSGSLAQLASRIVAMSKTGSDPFVKIRGMIEEMITKLEDQMGAEAQEKAYCDEEMSKTEAKKADLEATVEKLTNHIDKSSAKSAELKEEVATLQEELAAVAKEQATMDKVRGESHATFVEEKATLDKGLAGLRKGLQILRDYFGAASASLVQQPAAPAGHQADAGAGGSIISILEVAESDMAKELVKVETQEADEASAYESTTEENKLTTAAKSQDVKYKTQEAAGLDKSITELSNDRDTSNSELSEVNAYYTKLQGRCVAKPVPYEEKKKAREAEIAGLKEALNVLENEAALVQTKRSLRGVSRHA